MIIYRENIVSNRVSDAAARQRNKHAPSIVKNGSIVCVSPRCDPTWVSQCLALRVYFSTSLLWLIWSIHGNCCGLYCSLCAMTEVDLRYDEIEWEESSDGIFIYVLQCTKSNPNWVWLAPAVTEAWPSIQGWIITISKKSIEKEYDQ